jgi:hypothetical protein
MGDAKTANSLKYFTSTKKLSTWFIVRPTDSEAAPFLFSYYPDLLDLFHIARALWTRFKMDSLLMF